MFYKYNMYRSYDQISKNPKEYVPYTSVYYNPDIFGFLYGKEYTIKELYDLIKKYTFDYNTYKMIRNYPYKNKKGKFDFDFDTNILDETIKNTLCDPKLSDVDKMFYCGDVEGKYKEGHSIYILARRKLKYLFKGLREISCQIETDNVLDEYDIIDKRPNLNYHKN